MNVKFHMNCENTGKIWKISYVRCNFVKFDIYFLGHPQQTFFQFQWNWKKSLVSETKLKLKHFVSVCLYFT